MRGPLVPDDLFRGLHPLRIPSRIVCLAESPSTNDACWEAARAGEAEGYTVTAERQTQGRGRHGRAWHSPPGLGIAVSILLRPALGADRLPLLTAAAAVAAAEAAGPDARIRWPNDVVLGGRKLAGVIVEGREPRTFVLGCGLNVNLLPSDFPPELRTIATSLRIERSAPQDRGAVLRALLERLDFRYDQALSAHPDLGSAWRERSALLGKRVRIVEAGREYCGAVEDLDVLEGISVRLDGSVRRFRLEHVEMLRESTR